MKDILGQEIKVGDAVVHANHTRGGGLSTWIVSALTPKRVKLGSGRWPRVVSPDCLIVVDEFTEDRIRAKHEQ